jgi:hypothetical protein
MELFTWPKHSLTAWNLKAHLSQKAIIGLYVPRGINSVFPFTLYLFGIHFNIFPSSTPWPLLWDFPSVILYSFLISPILIACTFNLS